MTDEKPKRVLVLAIGHTAELVSVLQRIANIDVEPIVLHSEPAIEAPAIELVDLEPPMLPLVRGTRQRGPNLSRREQRQRQMQHTRKR